MTDPLCVFGRDRYALGLLAVLVSAASVPAAQASTGDAPRCLRI
jgi:hypothetical protein